MDTETKNDCWFVTPEDTRLELSGGHWLHVRKRLTHGERDDAFARRYIADPFGIRANLKQQTGLATLTAYILDWSLTGYDGRPMVIRGKDGRPSFELLETAINLLHEDRYNEILEVVTAHQRQMEEERAALKKTRSGEAASSPTSPLPSAAAGATSGSEP